MAKFSKLVTKTDIHKRLSMRSSHVRDFPEIDESGFVWTFQCSTRKKGHPKPVLAKGWLTFVRHKELKAGDRVKFFKVKDQSDTATPFYRIEAEKEIKIFGCRHNFYFNMVLEASRNFNLVSLFTFIQVFHLNFVVILTNSIVFLQFVKCFDGNFN
uniref:TF-B3 domain-containing protein n=1 Tax=Populus trichocarpa TaxID=3694 RepID=U5FWZ0_POPTR